jgi:hypothetical protein
MLRQGRLGRWREQVAANLPVLLVGAVAAAIATGLVVLAINFLPL